MLSFLERKTKSMRIAVCAALMYSAAGCGGEPSTVVLEGRVTIDGVAVQEGVVDFVAQGAGGSATAEISGGAYRAEVPTGTIRVFVHATRDTGNKVDYFGKQVPETVNIIPPRYKSGMVLDVSPDDSQHDFELRTR